MPEAPLRLTKGTPDIAESAEANHIWGGAKRADIIIFISYSCSCIFLRTRFADIN